MTEPVLGLQQLDAQLNPNALELEVEGLDFPRDGDEALGWTCAGWAGVTSWVTGARGTV